MPKMNCQNDIVKAFLNQNNLGEITEEICYPGIHQWFERAPFNAREQIEKVKIIGSTLFAHKSRKDIAESIVDLFNSYPDITGFIWTVENNYVEVKRASNFRQMRLANESEEDSFINLIITILKSRSNIIKVEWDFGQDHVKITHT